MTLARADEDVPVDNIARILEDRKTNSDSLAKSIEVFYFCLGLSSPEFMRLHIQRQMKMVSFFGHLKMILEQFVTEKGHLARVACVLEALERSENVLLKEKLEEKYPPECKVVMGISHERKKELAQRYVPIRFQLPTPLETFSYISRKAETDRLFKLYSDFQESASAAGAVLLSGPEGVGKGTFASNFCHLVRDISAHSIIWIHAKTRFEVNSQLQLLGEKLCLEKKEESNIAAKLIDIYEYHREVPMVIVLEDVEEDSLLLYNILEILNFLPPPKAFVIITSVAQKFSNAEMDVISLHPFPLPVILEAHVQAFKKSGVVSLYFESEENAGQVNANLTLFEGWGLSEGVPPLDFAIPDKLFKYRRDAFRGKFDAGDFVKEGGKVEINWCVEEGIKLLQFEEERLNDCGRHVLFLITCILPLKKFPYSTLLKIFETVWHQRKMPKRAGCFRLLDWVVTDGENGGDPVSELWSAVESSTILGRAVNVLVKLGFCNDQPIIYKPNIYKLDDVFVDRYIEVHDRVRNAVAAKLGEQYTEWKTTSVNEISTAFPFFPTIVQDFLRAHSKEILSTCSDVPNQLHLELLPQMSFAYASKLRNLSYFCAQAVLFSMLGLLLSTACFKHEAAGTGPSPSPSPYPYPYTPSGTAPAPCGWAAYSLATFSFLGLLLFLPLLTASVEGRYHPQNKIGKLLIFNETLVKFYLKYVFPSSLFFCFVLFLNISFVAPVASSLMPAVPIILFIIYRWKAPKGNPKKADKPAKVLLPL